MRKAEDIISVVQSPDDAEELLPANKLMTTLQVTLPSVADKQANTSGSRKQQADVPVVQKI